jgi:hypothetical protein
MVIINHLKNWTQIVSRKWPFKNRTIRFSDGDCSLLKTQLNWNFTESLLSWFSGLWIVTHGHGLNTEILFRFSDANWKRDKMSSTYLKVSRFGNRTSLDHVKMWLVQYSDSHYTQMIFQFICCDDCFSVLIWCQILILRSYVIKL